MPPPASPPADQLVTSSDLVRQFGLWQERATRAPLYILHRGRPRFVLTSVETMEALCAPHSFARGPALPARDAIDATALLDGVSDMVLLVDPDGTILATSRAARAHFGATATIGGAVDEITSPDSRAALVAAIDQVVATGIGVRLDIASARREGRLLAVSVEPAGRGVALFAQDGTSARDLARAHAAERALDAAMLAAGGVAMARIDSTGLIVDPGAALAALTDRPRAALSALPFVALAEPAAQAPLAAAIDASLAGAVPDPLTATLAIAGAAPRAVRIGLAAAPGPANPGVTAMIITI